MGVRKRGISHVYLTEPFDRNAVLTSSAQEYILFNHIAVKSLMKGNVHDEGLLFTFPPSGSNLLDLKKQKTKKNQDVPFSSFK